MKHPSKPKVRYRPLFGGIYPFGGMCQTGEWSYYDGFITGRDWDMFAPHNNYVPGGPYISTYTAYHNPNPALLDYCNATRINNVRWMEGWHDGQAYIKALLGAYKVLA